jgi:acyl carrier protein
LLWFFPTSAGVRFYESKAVAPLRDRVLQIICDNLGVKKEGLTLTTSFTEEVGANSLDLVEMVMDLEQESGVGITEEEARGLRTVGDVIDYLAIRNL